MESMFIVFWIIVLVHVTCVKKTDSAIDDFMYEVEEESKNSRDYLLSYPSDKVDGSVENVVRFQYDILLDKTEYYELMGHENRLPLHRVRRVATKNRLWPNGRIPYTIDDSFNTTEQLCIKDAILMWMRWTCLNFVPAKKDYNKLTFVDTTRVCGKSYVGMREGEQKIYISHKCSTNLRVVAHEIGHAIGLFHEQMRNDRDDYVTVLEYNILNTEDANDNFRKMKENEYNDFSKPYDYLSIMHYGKLFLSRNKTLNLETLVPKNESYLDIIGNVQTVSYNDAKIVCQLYNCKANCKPTCPGNGFIGTNCQCMCRGPSDDDPIKHCQKLDVCGDGYSEYRCQNGEWKGDLPECNFLDCVLETMQYNICGNNTTITASVNDTKIENCIGVYSYQHGENITLSCKSDLTKMETSQCNNGSWTTVYLDCPKESCNMPSVNYSKYDVLDKNYKPIPTNSGSFDNGTTVEIVWNDILLDVCGDGYSEYRCQNGEWKGDLPECNFLDCVLETMQYNICGNNTTITASVNDTTIENCTGVYSYQHGENITLSCKSDLTKMETSQCTNGSWTTVYLNCAKDVKCEYKVTNGELTKAPNGIGYKLTCDIGFKSNLQVSDTVSCKEGKLKSEYGLEPACNLDSHPCLIPINMNGIRVTQGRSMLTGGVTISHTETAIFNCGNGQEPQGREFKCNDGAWIAQDYGTVWKFENKGVFPHCRNAYCSNKCNNHGTCVKDGVCECHGMHKGLECEQGPDPCSIPIIMKGINVTQGRSVLSGGVTINDMETVKVYCANGQEPQSREFKCDNGAWRAQDDDENWTFENNGTFPQCRNAHCSNNCNNHGTCVKDGVCECDQIHRGKECEQGYSYTFEEAKKMDFPGEDDQYSHIPRSVDYKQCKVVCAQIFDCKGVFYHVTRKSCFLMKHLPDPTLDKSHTSKWMIHFYKKTIYY